MSKQISAVEWLENEFKEMCKDFGGLHTDFIERFEQAKKMEKERLITSIRFGLGSLGEWTPELENSILKEYETFKSE